MTDERTFPTYRMRMRVVRGAPHFDTVELPEMVDVRASNAWAAEAEATRRVLRDHPGARDAYAITRRRV